MARSGTGDFPKRRSKRLIVQELGSEALVYDAEADEAHCLTPLAAAVFRAADGETSVEALTRAAGTRLEEPVSASQVRRTLKELTERGLLAGSMLSRRALVQRASAVGGMALASTPMISTIMAPTPAMAQSAQCPIGFQGFPGGLCIGPPGPQDTCPPGYQFTGFQGFQAGTCIGPPGP
jgi:hypothetical protein